jgi:hypothetical protein
MRIAFASALLLIAASAFAQQPPALGARTQTPDQLMARMNQTSPEEEMRQLEEAANQHPLGTIANPIRVGGPEGEHAYLGRLRCADGSQLRIGARHDAGIGGFGSVVGAYEVSCAGVPTQIAFDMYQEEHVETRAPAGFTLAR